MSDRILLKGNSKLLKPIITQLLATHQLLENLDIEGGYSNDKEMVAGRAYHPLIKLHFKQDTDFVAGTKSESYKGRNRRRGEISFRLMNETTESISKGELTNIANKIKEVFGSNGGYVWSKGKELYCYADWNMGYQLQILARTKNQAADLVTKVLSLQGHSPQWKYFTRTENSVELEAYPETEQKKIILGEEVILPKLRPLSEVRFQYSVVTVHKLIPPITLYDRRGKKPKPLVS